MADTIKAQIDLANRIERLNINTKKCAKTKITKGYLETRSETLDKYWLDYTTQHDKIVRTVKEDVLKLCNFQPEDNYDQTEELYLELKTLIKDAQFSIQKDEMHSSVKENSNGSTEKPESAKIRPKLPPISIPTFSGDYGQWISFKDIFISLIHNDTCLSKVEKHHYLKSALSGEAENLLKHFAPTEANYDEAWKMLESRYDNKRIIVNNILNRLLNQKKLLSESATGLKDLLDTTKESLNSLSNLKIETEKWDAIVVHIIVSKLDIESHKLWEQSLGSSTEIPSFDDLATFMEGRFRTVEMMTLHAKEPPKSFSFKRDLQKHTQPIQKPTVIKSFAAEVESTCTYCSQKHYISHCKEFASLAIPERQTFTKNNNLCFNCMIKGHSVSNCRQSTTCKKCGRRHHTLLHYTNPNKTVTTTQTTTPENSTAKENVACTVSMKAVTKSEQTILATALIPDQAKNGNTVILRALIDQGSQASFVTEAAAQLLNLDRTSVSGNVTGIANDSVPIKYMVTLKTDSLSVNAYILRKLTSLLPLREFTPDWPLSKHLNLADPQFHKPGPIDVLLGAEVHAQIILEGIQRHESLIAVNSQLGWLISGKVSQPDKHNFVTVHSYKVSTDHLLRQFWEIEEYSPNKKPITKLEIQCEEHYRSTQTRTHSGRYVVKLPFKDEIPTNLGGSRSLAVSRLHHMEKRFTHRPEFKEEYCKFMRQYEVQGHMEIIPEETEDTDDSNLRPEKENETQKKYYLPHHAVVRPMSLSTKLRVVFDATVKPEKGNSLNDELMIGPPLQQDIRDLITRWRRHKYVLVADIQQMYRQILVSKDDVDYQRILWRETPNDPIKEYRLLTVTYGTSSAPFLAIRTLHQLADDERADFPDVADVLKTDFYMDDLMTGASTEDDAAKLQKRLTQLLARGGFLLHKWSSNSAKVLSEIPDSIQGSQSAVNINFEDVVKALGIRWNPQSDMFELKMVLDFKTDNITKRNVLSAIAKTFDPLGWLAPSGILLKIFMQKLWLAGLSWDEELTDKLKSEWFTYVRNFVNSQPILLPRWHGILDTTTKIELHGFGDASCAAYACVVYLRVWDGNGMKVRLVAAKAKPAPIKQISLPRLELCGAVLLARMILEFKTSLNISDECVFAWTDSTIVLAWLRKNPSTWTTFVANRTSEILMTTNSSQWHHVRSVDNPADLASRGVMPNDLSESKLWWEGPHFLRNYDDVLTETDIPDTELESKTKVISHLCTEENTTDVNTYLKRFSSLLKLIRVTAFCLRFAGIHKAKLEKKPKLPTYLTATEINHALNACIRMSQSLHFRNEINLLSQGKTVPKTSKLYTLNPLLDTNNVLRVGGRLVNAPIPNDMKSPILLSNKCYLSELIVSDAHHKTLHGGHQLTCNYIRNKYWIIRGKDVVKGIVRKCIQCFKQRAQPSAPFMGNLPKHRVTPARPFLTSGVDYAGPFLLKLYSGRCNRTYKAYIALFVCTVTKAIHLELVSDLTSSAYLAAFRRFTSRRGHCQDLWSDCGTNFVGASRELDLAFRSLKSTVVSEIAELLANDQTTWHFNPPGTPHFGGLWESGVKSIKGHLKRVIGQTLLTYEQFSTLLTQVEACVNSRPLTLMDSSSDEPPLTPGHFLIGEPPIVVPEACLVDTKISLLNHWHTVQRFVQNLWRRWQSEYLTNLQHRYKWSKNQPDIQIGTVVLVKDDRLPPGKWLLGRVIKKHPGADGVTIVVTLQYKNNTFKRPVTKLCPLPLP